MGSGFAAAFRSCDRGQDASEYGMLLVMVALVVISGVIFFGRSVGQSLERTSECIEFASSADASTGRTGQASAAARVEEEKKSGSLADRLAALLDTNDGTEERAQSRSARAGRGSAVGGTARNLGRCPE